MTGMEIDAPLRRFPFARSRPRSRRDQPFDTPGGNPRIAAFIRDGAISGAGHVASKPGQVPNNNSCELAGSFHATEAVKISHYVQAAATVDAPCGLALELGASRMLPRSFLVPATKRQRAGIHEALVARKR